MTWDEFCEKARRTVGKTADKINQTADLAALQMKLTILENKLSEAYEKLGKVASAHFSDDDVDLTEKLSEKMANVETAIKNVEAMKAKIEQLKNKDQEL